MLPSITVIRRLLRNDLRLIARDSLLVFMFSLVLILGLACRLALPALDESLAQSGIMPSESTPLRFSDTYPLWMAFIGLWQAALLPGTAFAFLLLDEKEDHTLSAMRVTPVPLTSYLSYRCAVPTLFAFVFQIVLVPAIGFAPISALQLVVLAAASSLTAPLVTLFIAHLANDKMQGFAFTKFTGVAGLLILVGWFAGGTWQWVLSVFPHFAIAKGYWMAAAGEAWWWVPALWGGLAQLGLVAALLGRFGRRPPS